jgi:hypothetical protein
MEVPIVQALYILSFSLTLVTRCDKKKDPGAYGQYFLDRSFGE